MTKNDSTASSSAKVTASKYLTFTLSNEVYAIEITRVKEIIGLHEITLVPQAPKYVKGVINLRGKVVPVIDLRLKFGLPSEDYTERTCIIVLEVAMDGGVLEYTGVVVDAVSEVINIDTGNIEPTPPLGVQVDTEYILGMARMGDRVRILLDIDRALGAE
ncbi:MAG: purine-binding chemotaxis protein CheW [Deltaproteobacteria bacterium]|nr:purine-binding chemotaxis protein CheW [Deltaproteobacteria bacterium]